MKSSGYEKVFDEKSTSPDPQKEAGFFSLLTFWWINGVFKTGAKRPLVESDFLPLQREDDTQQSTEKLQQLWTSQQKKCAAVGKEPQLWKSVLSFLPPVQAGLLVLAYLVYIVCTVSQPILLGCIVSELLSSQSDGRPFLYVYASAMFFIGLVKTPLSHYFFYKTGLLGMHLKVALKSVVYLKIFFLDRETLKDFTTGHVVNLVSNDVQRMEQAAKALFCFWLSLLEIIVSGSLMCYFIGWPALVTLAFLALLALSYAVLARIIGKLRRKTAALTDRRVLMMNEIVVAIRTVKTNAWEWIYRKKIEKLRREEINAIRKKSVALSILAGFMFSASSAAVFISATVMALTNHVLTPANVFMLMAFINSLTTVISFNIGENLRTLMEAKVSISRIQKFLQLPNLPRLNETLPTDKQQLETTRRLSASEYSTTDDSRCNEDKDNCVKVQVSPGSGKEAPNRACTVSNLTLCPQENGARRILNNISFKASESSLVVLTGPVGSGKSSLLAAINQEVSISEGNISCPGTTAYVSQTPWVFQGTIRENILFGEDYDEQRFQEVVEVCALQKDFEMLPEGDETIVGERGVVLSGGQQARVNLARAVYADADVYLLDNPLSAVDAKVGEHIFERCIGELLSTKTRLLVSHHLSHMKAADEIILLSKGEVLAKGSFPEMSRSGKLDKLFDIDKESTTDVQSTSNGVSSWSSNGQKLKEGQLMAAGTKKAGLEIPEEDRCIGGVSKKLYWKYFRAGLPIVGLVGLIVVFVLAQGLLVSVDVWLSQIVKSAKDEQRKDLLVYTGLVFTALFITMLRAFLFFQASLSSSEEIHDHMVVAILKAPVFFFDTNPAGRVLNRFSDDVGSVDEDLPFIFLAAIQLVLYFATALLLPSVLNPWLLLAVVPVVVSFIHVARYYVKSSRELRRLESICRSPILSHFSETLNGLDTIRSRKRDEGFVQQFYRHQNKHNQVFNMCLAGIRWMGVRVDFLSALFTGCVAFSATIISQDAALAGLSLVYVIGTFHLAQVAVQSVSHVENRMTSVERMMTYTEIEPEPGYDVATKPAEDWPDDANIDFNNVSLRYYPGGPKILRDLNISIEGKAKIGVAGRTGAGKSSIIAALLRMPQAKGVVTIDGLNLATLNLQEARRHVSVLSQNPILFSGPLRESIDPLAQHQDADLWRVLEQVQLKSLVEQLNSHLDYQVSEAGGNFSVGERQLFCLARVLLEGKKVLILDEPTAHVDPSTERTIQKTVRDHLKDCTVMTVTHRLNTIRHCDKILVMEGGTAVEFDSYEELVKMEDGVFATMVEKHSS